MAYRIKDYARFQHFKDRNPPWVKLYRDILDDPDWHDLDAGSAKVLVMLWLIASEDETKNGRLPDNRRLCFRLRISEKDLAQAIIKLSHWLEHDDIDAISNRCRDDAPERAGEETERETEREAEREHCAPAERDSVPECFDEFWIAYDKKVGKANAIKAWKSIRPDTDLIQRIVSAAKRYSSATERQYRKDPERWLKGSRWEDDSPSAGTAVKPDIFSGGI